MHAISVVHSLHLLKGLRTSDAAQEGDTKVVEKFIGMDSSPDHYGGRNGNIIEDQRERIGDLQRSAVYKSENGHQSIVQPISCRKEVSSGSLIDGV
jgi:hypothetical protein